MIIIVDSECPPRDQVSPRTVIFGPRDHYRVGETVIIACVLYTIPDIPMNTFLALAASLRY